LKRSGAGVVVTMHQVVEPASIDAEFTRLHRVRVPAGLARLALGGVQDTIRRQADATIVHEQAFAEVVEGSHVVPLGIDRPAGAHPTTHHVAARRLKLDDARLTVLCFGFLSPYKGLEQALEAARLAGPEVDLVLAGGPHPRLQRNGRDGYAETLASGYKETARFTGYVPEHEVAPWFAAADVVLIPYPRPFSSSGPLAQALGHQRPVLLSEAMARCAGAPDDLATSIEPEALAARLVRLARQPDERDRLARASAQLAEGRTWPAVAQSHLAIYGEVTGAQHPQRAARRAVRR
jgi:glycosyltransferase involved in cell wall biosynthesis